MGVKVRRRELCIQPSSCWIVPELGKTDEKKKAGVKRKKNKARRSTATSKNSRRRPVVLAFGLRACDLTAGVTLQAIVNHSAQSAAVGRTPKRASGARNNC